MDKSIAAQIARPAPAPGQAFENLYFVGGAWASAFPNRLFRACRSRLPRLGQRLHDDRQNISRRNIIERPSDRFGELDVGVELGDQFADKWHVDRARDDVDPIGAHVS